MLRSNNLGLLIFIALSVMLLQGSVLAQPTEDFVNTAIEPQTSVFVATFNATATVDSVDGVLGLSEVEPTGYGDFKCKILFNNAGLITASNGASFEAETVLAYEANKSYAVKQLVNILDQTYSVWVTPDGGEEVTIGENFAFTEGVVDSLNWRSVKMGFGFPWGGNEGMVEVTDFTMGYPEGLNVNTHFDLQTGRFMVEFNAYPTADLLDGVIGFTEDKPGSSWDYSQPVKLLFNNSGLFTARNAGGFEAVNDFSYSGGTSYQVRMVVDIPMQTYDVWIAPEGGEEVVIAEDFAFDGAVDTLQWRTVVMSHGGPPWEGAYGLVEVTNFAISDAPDDRLSCAFFSKKGWDSRDSLLVVKLEETYDVSILNPRDIYNEIISIDTLYNFDFTFISESVSSWPWEYGDGPKIRSIPIPMLLLEGWLSKPEVLGWTTASADTGYGTLFQDSTQLGVANNVLIIDDTGHDLAAGFGFGTEVTLVSDSYVQDILTFTVPEIDHIPIAVSSLYPEQTIVMGVEEGTIVWNKDGTVLGESDSTVTKSRTAMIGIFASANDFITADGFKLIEAGIEWILQDPATAIDDLGSLAPSEFNLAQNYPNPFNPSTEIAFTLSKPGHTTLTIFNVLGQKVANLLDMNMVKGKHQVTFDSQAYDLSSGVYFYQIRSNEFSQIKKMVLMK